jgi:hypothetical protein
MPNDTNRTPQSPDDSAATRHIPPRINHLQRVRIGRTLVP